MSAARNILAPVLILLGVFVFQAVAQNSRRYAAWAEDMNKELLLINREAAAMTWAALVGAKFEANHSLEEIRIAWRENRCQQASFYLSGPAMVRRAIYLLCRGPHYSHVIARILNTLLEMLSTTYREATLCIDHITNCYHVEPELQAIMKTSRDPQQLLRVWVGWRDAVGPVSNHIYQSMIKVQNDAATSVSRYKDMGECWREELEMPWILVTVERLMLEVAPLHRLLHAYVRWSLRNYYGGELVSETGPIPAHLLGNMWSQSWENIMDIVVPDAKFDLDDRLRSRYENVTELVEEAERFYVSLGLSPMTSKFWENSVISKKNEKVMCHGTAANMFDKDDYRMLVCANMTWDDFYVIHHEMGHIQYFMAYENLPAIFQDGANSAFQEAIGDTIMLAVETPSHLQRLGIIQQSDEDTEFLLLLYQALKKIPQIPFGLVVDKWRWGVMASNITPDEYNSKWWSFRNSYEGLKHPIPRSAYSFDPMAKFHIADNTPYIRYFLSIFLQFQFLEVLCDSKDLNNSSPRTPLHLCDLFGYEEGGDKLREMMEQGNTKPWHQLLYEFSEERYNRISAKPLLAYFSPLSSWLQEKIKKYNIAVGW